MSSVSQYNVFVSGIICFEKGVGEWFWNFGMPIWKMYASFLFVYEDLGYGKSAHILRQSIPIIMCLTFYKFVK